MADNQQVPGSQAGQGGSGSQAGQNAGSGQQGQGADGSSQGQQGQSSQQAAAIRLDGMLEGETLEQAWQRVNGALTTARKQAGSYRQRLQTAGIDLDDTSQTQQSSGNSGQQGQQGQNQQGNDVAARMARLEADLRAEKSARRADRITSQLVTAAANEGAVHPSLLVRLIDLEGLEIGADSTITDPIAAVRALKATVPQMFSDTRGNGDGGAGNAGGGEPTDFNAMIRARAGIKPS